MNKSGFSLIELMIVVAIIAFLAIISVPTFTKFLAKAKRAEAYMHLNALYIAQKAYWADHGKYASALTGDGGLGWKPEGYKGGGNAEQFYYTYGFGGGTEGIHYCTGKLGTASTHLSAAFANDNEFIIAAAGDIDGDGKPDILVVDHVGNIRVVQDDLSD